MTEGYVVCDLNDNIWKDLLGGLIKDKKLNKNINRCMLDCIKHRT